MERINSSAAWIIKVGMQVQSNPELYALYLLINKNQNTLSSVFMVGRDSAVGMATGC